MGKTLKGLFDSFDMENLCQLYLYPSYPNIDMCNSYFRITDIEVLKSIISREKSGNIIDKSKIKEENLIFDDKLKARNPYTMNIKKKSYMMLARDLIWRLGRWRTQELLEWIKREKPDIIFFASGDSCFSYNIALNISESFNIPLVTYFCDDYYSMDRLTLSPLYWTNKLLIRKYIKIAIERSKKIIYISEDFEQFYYLLTGKHGITIMTPFSEIMEYDKISESKPLVISYIGNVTLNRWQTLKKIGQTLDRYNIDKTQFILKIYTQNDNKRIIDELSECKSIVYMGALSTAEVLKTMKESNFLLHVESFKKSDAIRVRFSISTKIADYLASNKPIIAIGPQNIASIKYLRENNAAYVIDNESMIEEKMIKYLTDERHDDLIIKNAIILADKNHNLAKNSQKIKSILENIVKG
jgi:hypothetical protein